MFQETNMAGMNATLSQYSRGVNSAHIAGLKLAKGEMRGHSVGFTFGCNGAVGAASYETVWENGGVYEVPTTATVASISSSSVNDTAAGTGARTIYLEGLDEDYNLQSEIVSLNGTSTVTSTNSYLRMNKVTVVTAGSLGEADGTITVTVDSKTLATIVGDNNQAQVAFYTVPAGCTMYLYQFQFTVGQGKEVDVKLVSRRNGQVFRTVASLRLYQNEVGFTLAIPLPLPEKSDFQIMAKAATGSVEATATYGYVLVDNAEAL